MRTITAALTISLLALVLATTGLAKTAATTTQLATQLNGTVGPGFSITLKKNGKVVKKLTHGKYTFVIADKSSIHDFHLTGPGVNKKTTVGGMGTTRWTITLKAGAYHYVCDPHAAFMKGSFTVS